MQTKTNKLRIFSIIYITLSISAFSQVETIKWLKDFKDEDGFIFNKTCRDSVGNVILIGQFWSESFCYSESEKISNRGENDVYIIKIDQKGEILWKTSIGGISGEYFSNIELDNDDNFYITGFSNSEELFVGNNVINSDPGEKVFVIKISTDGLYEWSFFVNVYSYGCKLKTIRLDQQSNLYLLGTFNDKIQLGDFELTENSSSLSNYFCKIQNNGTVEWADVLFPDSTITINDFQIDEENNFYLTGMIVRSIEKYDMDIEYEYVHMITKIDEDRNLVWNKTDTILGEGIVIKKIRSDFIVLSQKYIYGGIFIGGMPKIISCLTIINKNGEILTYYSLSEVSIADFLIDQDSGNGIYITGEFYSDILEFGDYTLYRQTDSSTSCYKYPDILLAKFDELLEPCWVISYEGELSDVGNSIVKDTQNHIYLAGEFQSYKLTFDSTPVINESEIKGFGHLGCVYYSRQGKKILVKYNTEQALIKPVNKILIDVYPIPAKEYIHYQINKPELIEAYLNIYDHTGKLVLPCTIERSHGTLYVGDLSNGYYIVRIIHGKNIYTSKFIK